MDQARQAFSCDNFEIAAELYEQEIKQHGPNQELLPGLADSLARAGQLKKALSSYSKANRFGDVSSDQLCQLVTSLMKIMSDHLPIKESAITSIDIKDDIFLCTICNKLWRDPVTIRCGHTFCHKCLEKEQSNSCNKCGVERNSLILSEFKTNLLLSQATEKWFQNELNSLKLKDDGNIHFEARDFTTAVARYSQALTLGKYSCN